MGQARRLARRGKPRPMEVAKEAARAEANGYMCCLTMAWLHIRHGYGEKRIRKAFEDYCRFFQDMERAGTSTGDLVALIRDECGGFDMAAAFERLDRRVAVEEAEWERERTELEAARAAREQEAELCRKS